MYSKFLKMILALTLLQTPLKASTGQDLSLDDIYQAALKTSEHTDYIKSLSNQSQATYQQARSYLFPSISLQGNYLDTRYQAKNSDTETRSKRKLAGLQLRQPLFQGGLLAGLEKEKLNKQKTELDIQKENLNLYQQVAENFYKIILYESTLNVLNEIEVASRKRIEELERRVRIGRSKQTDLLTNELQNQSLKIEIGNLEALISSEREIFFRLTGYAQSTRFKVNTDLPRLESLHFYLEQLSVSPDLQIQNKNLAIAEKSSQVASAQHFPYLYLDLEANYGELSSTQEGKEYVGMLTLEIPIFEGGRTRAEASEAHWKKIEEQSKRDKLLKDLQSLIKNTYSELQKKSAQFQFYENALKISKKNYEIHNKELRLGLVSNIELLNSLSTYLESKKNREEAFYQIKMLEVKLSQIIGKKI